MKRRRTPEIDEPNPPKRRKISDDWLDQQLLNTPATSEGRGRHPLDEEVEEPVTPHSPIDWSGPMVQAAMQEMDREFQHVIPAPSPSSPSHPPTPQTITGPGSNSFFGPDFDFEAVFADINLSDLIKSSQENDQTPDLGGMK